MTKKFKIAIGTAVILMTQQGCVSLVDNTIYPCSIGCGNEGLTPPMGYVYYQNKLMSLEEFNHITNQNIVIQ